MAASRTALPGRTNPRPYSRHGLKPLVKFTRNEILQREMGGDEADDGLDDADDEDLPFDLFPHSGWTACVAVSADPAEAMISRARFASSLEPREISRNLSASNA
jgi:hypothetical protein